jgi:glucosamine--fructose-6-phosphate aminotransferase (isomerizing)
MVNKGHKFKSQTDTEVIVHLITENLKTTELHRMLLQKL